MTSAQRRQWKQVTHFKVTQGIKHTQKCKRKGANKKKNQNKMKAMIKTKNWKSLAQQHKNTMCYCCGEKGHCVSEGPMKDKMPQENWAIKKGMQMVQNPNDEATAEGNKTMR